MIVLARSEAPTSDVISSAECRQFAAGRLARQTVSRREKDALYGMARAWEALAKYIEQYEEGTPRPSRMRIECCAGSGGADAVLRASAYVRGRLVRMVRPQRQYRRRASKTFPTRAAAAAELEKLQTRLDLAKAKVLRRAPEGR